jgi:hypothetical protein
MNGDRRHFTFCTDPAIEPYPGPGAPTPTGVRHLRPRHPGRAAFSDWLTADVNAFLSPGFSTSPRRTRQAKTHTPRRKKREACCGI